MLHFDLYYTVVRSASLSTTTTSVTCCCLFITATHTSNITNSCHFDTITLRHYVTALPNITVTDPTEQNPPSQDEGHSTRREITGLIQN
jgi:hypothetical protein